MTSTRQSRESRKGDADAGPGPALRPLLAADVMTHDPIIVTPESKILGALAMMRAHDFRHLMVVAENMLVGVLSNRDYRRVLERLNPGGVAPDLRNIPIAEIMTPAARVITASLDTPLLNVAQLMVLRKVGCIPVLDDTHRLVGLLTHKDVLRVLTERLLAHPSALHLPTEA